MHWIVHVSALLWFAAPITLGLTVVSEDFQDDEAAGNVVAPGNYPMIGFNPTNDGRPGRWVDNGYDPDLAAQPNNPIAGRDTDLQIQVQNGIRSNGSGGVAHRRHAVGSGGVFF